MSTDDFAAYLEQYPLEKYLEERGLEHLADSTAEILKWPSLRDVRTRGVDESSVQTFAHAVVRGATSNAECKHLLQDHGDAFKFTYGCSWEEAAAGAAARYGGKAKKEDTSLSAFPSHPIQ